MPAALGQFVQEDDSIFDVESAPLRPQLLEVSRAVRRMRSQRTADDDLQSRPLVAQLVGGPDRQLDTLAAGNPKGHQHQGIGVEKTRPASEADALRPKPENRRPVGALGSDPDAARSGARGP